MTSRTSSSAMRSAAALASSIAFLYLGCAQSSPPPASPSTSPQAAYPQATAGAVPAQPTYDVSSTRPKTVADAASELDSAEKQVQALVGTGPRVEPLASDGCEVACKALASMRTAAAHLCELSTDEPDRCEGAKSRVDRATARVKEVCPSCVDAPT
jgi:hypothetical protein